MIGSVMKGLFCNLGANNESLAELWGLFLSIQLARRLALPSVIFEIDSQVVFSYKLNILKR